MIEERTGLKRHTCVLDLHSVGDSVRGAFLIFPADLCSRSISAQSSYFPGLNDDNGKPQGFVETLPFYPFTLCKINCVSAVNNILI